MILTCTGAQEGTCACTGAGGLECGCAEGAVPTVVSVEVCEYETYVHGGFVDSDEAVDGVDAVDCAAGGAGIGVAGGGEGRGSHFLR